MLAGILLPWKSHSNLPQEGRPSKTSSEGSDRALQQYPLCPDAFIASGFAASFDFDRHHLSCCGDTWELGHCLHAPPVFLFMVPILLFPPASLILVQPHSEATEPKGAGCYSRNWGPQMVRKMVVLVFTKGHLYNCLPSSSPFPAVE